jgi:predicted enzyme related to lactoylglutathione lyase
MEADMDEMNPVGWFEIYVKDMNRAKSFYEAMLEVSLTKLPQPDGDPDGMWTFPMNEGASGATGALVKMDGAPVGAGGTIIYFVTEDCAVTAGRAKDAGGQIVKDKFSIGDYGNIALVSDPDGNIVGLHSMT